MSDCMTFPDTVEEYMEQYKIVDTERVYTNGVELVPIFRMKQWFEHLPSAQPERKNGEWIPCSERLPEDDTLMLVNYIDERPDAMDIWIGWHEMENVWYINGEEHSREHGNEVVAWMPLPEPYKEEQA